MKETVRSYKLISNPNLMKPWSDLSWEDRWFNFLIEQTNLLMTHEFSTEAEFIQQLDSAIGAAVTEQNEMELQTEPEAWGVYILIDDLVEMAQFASLEEAESAMERLRKCTTKRLEIRKVEP